MLATAPQLSGAASQQQRRVQKAKPVKRVIAVNLPKISKLSNQLLQLSIPMVKFYSPVCSGTHFTPTHNFKSHNL